MPIERDHRPSRGRRAGAARGEEPPRRDHRRLSRAVAPIDVLPPGHIEAIHEASLRLVETIGIEFMGQSARDILKQAGAEVDDASGLVRIDREIVRQSLALAPQRFTLTPRNSARQIALGDDHVNFSLVAGPPFVHDSVQGRRGGNLADYERLIRLAQSFDIIHYIGNQPTVPLELPAETRHLDCYRANIVNSDKVFHCTAIGAERALDGIAMMAIARGISRDEMAASPAVLTIISVNSPRRFDEAMTDGLAAMAAWGQAVCVTPFTLMGAMTPVTITAALIQQNAEALAGLTLAQLVRPGVPVIYGAFTSNVDLRSGAPAFGTPENVIATLAAGQLARRYGLPYRASNSNAANAVDAQAAYESMNSLWASVMGGAHLVYHGAGWMEGGLQASFEKVVVDVEMMQMMAEIVTTPVLDDIEEVLQAIAEVPPGGHFFGAAHTLKRYRNAFYEPLVSDWRNHGAWSEAGSPTAIDRARSIWQEKLERFIPPPLERDVLERLDAYVAERKRALAAF
ncbi:MAG: trimethylamine methyltransferase family protein [Aestuariivirgaceae bacterium]